MKFEKIPNESVDEKYNIPEKQMNEFIKRGWMGITIEKGESGLKLTESVASIEDIENVVDKWEKKGYKFLGVN
ncbi:hypothetical protein KKH59_04815 [Patescibacteria group bacterium]|nr:hypothetical protein [Patescibacteria group bacterium]MBU4481597.1 hypothetical protein [Patescibacteria group bacterium]